LGVIDVIVTAIAVALVNQGLQIEREGPIGLAQWNRDGGETLAHWQRVKFAGPLGPGAANANEAIAVALGRDTVCREGDHTLARAHEVDFHQVRGGTEEFTLFLNVDSLSLAAAFVRRTEEFNDADHRTAAAFSDLDVAFGQGFVFEEKNHRFGHRHTPRVLNGWPAGRTGMILRHVKVWNDATKRAGLGLDIETLLDAGTEVMRKLRAKLVSGVRDQPLMDIAPPSFQIRVHPWKRTLRASNVGAIHPCVKDFSTAR
jgi:hypothetical protein